MRVVFPWSTCPIIVITGDFLLILIPTSSWLTGNSLPLMILSILICSGVMKLALPLLSCFLMVYSLIFNFYATEVSDSSPFLGFSEAVLRGIGFGLKTAGLGFEM